jgi:hypothetical protein
VSLAILRMPSPICSAKSDGQGAVLGPQDRLDRAGCVDQALRRRGEPAGFDPVFESPLIRRTKGASTVPAYRVSPWSAISYWSANSRASIASRVRGRPRRRRRGGSTRPGRGGRRRTPCWRWRRPRRRRSRRSAPTFWSKVSFSGKVTVSPLGWGVPGHEQSRNRWVRSMRAPLGGSRQGGQGVHDDRLEGVGQGRVVEAVVGEGVVRVAADLALGDRVQPDRQEELGAWPWCRPSPRSRSS